MAVAGGLVRIEVEGLVNVAEATVRIGGVEADIIGASPQFITIRVPDAPDGEVSVVSGDDEAVGTIGLGTVFADELHPVANPVIDSFGHVFVTFSGARGENVPFGVFRVSPSGEKEPFLGDIVNPTGLAIGPDGLLYVSSRHSGTVFRSTYDKRIDKFAEGLGIATGMAFDSAGNLLVGDRSGTIYRISPDQQVSSLCEIEPSVSAFHLAVDKEDSLFVSGPTLATQDRIYRISPSGEVETWFKGFGRPQGLAFDGQGRLHVAGSFRGRKGVFRMTPNHVPELIIAAPMLVGMAFEPSAGLLYLVDGSCLFRIAVE